MTTPSRHICTVRQPEPRNARERGVRVVIALTATMMVVEIAVGYTAHSMALTADGWHMATHVAAFGMAALGYAISRRFATHEAFAFGTGKVHALAGYTSAIALAIASLVMMVQSVSRLADPEHIDYASSLPVAVVGLAVNLLSIWLLHDHEHDEHDDDHGDHHPHDHNHRAAVLHVIADALTGLLAIIALLAGRWLGWRWLDPVTGIVGGLVILSWGFGLCRHASHELLDVRRGGDNEATIRSALEQLGDVLVRDLHVWSLGRGQLGCIVTLASPTPRGAAAYRALILERCPISHLTVEIEN
ncbi:MAG TPA: CDF family Co(II)/Ni(II) efflux transporter DmeF [Kofleriaceae bacterium]|nr:CDF family Co(II)/Ni(II) efflux transporter DmeF [Kofleriaceae bacterium]